jgi:hypothetical protein
LYTDEGMDEMEFIESQSNLNNLISEYEKFEICDGFDILEK